MSQDRIKLRQFSQLEYLKPEPVLQNFRSLEKRLKEQPALTASLNDRELRLRTDKLKKPREARLAAIFAYAIQECVLGVPVGFAPDEDSDYDFVLSWKSDTEPLFSPVQLKELPPDDINPKVSMKNIIGKLDKYSDSKDLTVAIHYNRQEHFEYGPWLQIKSVPVAQIWFFGGCSPDGNDWFLYGDLMKNPPLFYRFRYPSQDQDSEPR